MKNLILILVAILVMTTTPSEARRRQQLDRKGGVGGGGGDFLPGTKVTEQEVLSEINGIKTFLKPAFTAVEIFTTLGKPGELSQGTYKALFKNPITVYDFIDRVQVRPINEPCFNKHNQPQGAGVHNTMPNEYCVSLKQATDLLTTENLFPQLLAISVHEIVHKMQLLDHSELTEADEADAVHLQRVFLSNVTTMHKLGFNSNKNHLFESVKHLWLEASSIEGRLQREETPDVCNSLDNMTSGGLSANLIGAAFLPPVSKSSYVKASMSAIHLRMTKSYCPSMSGAAVPTRVFAPSELFRDVETPFLRENTESVTIVGTRDTKALLQIIQKVKRDFESVMMDIDAKKFQDLGASIPGIRASQANAKINGVRELGVSRSDSAHRFTYECTTDGMPPFLFHDGVSPLNYNQVRVGLAIGTYASEIGKIEFDSRPDGTYETLVFWISAGSDSVKLSMNHEIRTMAEIKNGGGWKSDVIVRRNATTFEEQPAGQPVTFRASQSGMNLSVTCKPL